MPTLTTKKGTIFNYPEGIEGELAVVQKGQSLIKLDTADVLELAEHLFEKARYETVIRLRIQEGDVLLVRTPPISESTAKNLEKQIVQGIIKPMNLEGKVQVAVLDGSLELEVISQD